MWRWREHSFKEVLNGEPPTEELQVKQNQEELDINVGEITKGEVLRSIKSLKNGKPGGVDNIPPEAFKAGDSVSAEALLKLLKQIWNEEEIPTDWKKGIIAKLPKKGDLGQCGNWRGITLLTIVNKILAKIILDRIKGALDARLCGEQAVFWKE